jgi:hypothetical protein
VSEGGHFYSSGFGSYAVSATAPEGVGVRSVSGHRAVWATSTGSSYGVDAESNTGTGVRGKSNSGYGVQGESAGVAVFGLSQGSVGVYGESKATSGSGGHGVFELDQFQKTAGGNPPATAGRDERFSGLPRRKLLEASRDQGRHAWSFGLVHGKFFKDVLLPKQRHI